MSRLLIPENYHSDLNLHDTQVAIKTVKDFFQRSLIENLNLLRVSAPLFVTPDSGLNDNLNGVERPVSFDVRDMDGAQAEIVHSLAKWKRYALKQYGFSHGEGLYTDMNAIRRDERCDSMHSLYVDQWDWEKVISAEDRNEEYLKSVVKKIVYAICDTELELRKHYPALYELSYKDRNVAFITSQELEDMYPDLSSKERENAFVKDHHTAFIMKIKAPEVIVCRTDICP